MASRELGDLRSELEDMEVNIDGTLDRTQSERRSIATSGQRAKRYANSKPGFQGEGFAIYYVDAT